MNINKYTPNLNDPRVINKIKHALGFARIFLRESEPRQLAKSLIDKHVGRSNEALGQWLRARVLTCVDHRYSQEAALAKRYVANKSGIESLRDMISSDDKQIALDAIKANYHQQLESGKFEYSDKASRLFNPIQHMRREDRASLLCEYGYVHDYDIDSAAPTLILEFARKQGFTQRVPTYERLITEKHAVREYLAQQLEITVDQAKRLINALLNGAKMGVSTSFQQFSTYDLLDSDKAKVLAITGMKATKDFEALPGDQFIKQLRNDIKKIWAYLADRHFVSTRFKPTKTGQMKRLPVTAAAKAELYRRIEREVMDEVSNYLNFICVAHLRIHDGFACREEIDEEEISAWISNKLGYQLNFSHSSIDCSLITCESPSASASDSLPVDSIQAELSFQSTATMASPDINQNNVLNKQPLVLSHIVYDKSDETTDPCVTSSAYTSISSDLGVLNKQPLVLSHIVYDKSGANQQESVTSLTYEQSQSTDTLDQVITSHETPEERKKRLARERKRKQRASQQLPK